VRNGRSCVAQRGHDATSSAQHVVCESSAERLAHVDLCSPPSGAAARSFARRSFASVHGARPNISQPPKGGLTTEAPGLYFPYQLINYFRKCRGSPLTIATLDDARLDETFAALANSTRRAILARLANGDASVNDLAAPFNLTLPAISKHIKVLENAGLITRGRRAQFRPCTINATALAEVAGWAEQYRHIWEHRFETMDNYVHKLQNTKQKKAR
jgi:DNA-binding transcriptional ArsR family regulator